MNFCGDSASFDALGYDPDDFHLPTSAASLFITLESDKRIDSDASQPVKTETHISLEQVSEQRDTSNYAARTYVSNTFELGVQPMSMMIAGDRAYYSPQVGSATMHSDDIKKIGEMKVHLQTAISLEQATIPLYLYAAYSLKTPGPAMWNILRVVSQEMLHLGLAGNILCAIGGYPALYKRPKDKGPNFTPKYPTTLLFQEIHLNLRGANKGNIRTFMELERPDPAVKPSRQSVVNPTKDAFEEYGSIGAFYSSISQGLEYLNDITQKKLFKKSSASRQLNAQDGSWYDDNMVQVTDLKSAKEAIKTIVDQGEGSPKALTSKPPQDKSNLDPPTITSVRSHFEVFEELYNGPKLDFYDVIENPKTSNYKGDPVYPILLASDAAYCYLLCSLEALWVKEDAKLRKQLITNNLQNLMMNVMRPIAKLLVTQLVTVSEVEDVTKHFGPPFNFYDFYQTDDTPLKQLQDLMAKALEAKVPAEALKALEPVKAVVDALVDIGPMRPPRKTKH